MNHNFGCLLIIAFDTHLEGVTLLNKITPVRKQKELHIPLSKLVDLAKPRFAVPKVGASDELLSICTYIVDIWTLASPHASNPSSYSSGDQLRYPQILALNRVFDDHMFHSNVFVFRHR